MKVNLVSKASVLVLLGLVAGQVAAAPWNPLWKSVCYYYKFETTNIGPEVLDNVLMMRTAPMGKLTTWVQEQQDFQGSPNPQQWAHTMVGKVLSTARNSGNKWMYAVSGSVIATQELGEDNNGAMMQISGSRADGTVAAWTQCTSQEASATPETWTCSALGLGNNGGSAEVVTQTQQLWQRVDTLPAGPQRDLIVEQCGGFLVLPDDAPLP